MSENPPLLSSKPLTRGQRRALSAIILSQRQAQEPVLANQVRKLQNNLRKSLLQASSEAQRNKAVYEYARAYGKAVERLVIRLAPLIERMMVGEKCVPGMETKAMSEKLRKWLDKYIANKITFVYDTTKNKVREWYAQSEGDFNKFESKLGQQFNPKRAELIARTESGFAMNSASAEISKEYSFGQKTEKEWIASFMTNARPFHEEMDGTVVDEDKRFRVSNPSGGYDMMEYPCDPRAPPVQVCNCRCCVSFRLKGL